MKEERWRPCLGGRYEASSLGRVRKCLTGRIISQRMAKVGYWRVTLYPDDSGKSRTFFVHQLVAEAFLGPRPAGMQVNHKDAVKTNNVPGNLEYLSAGDNIRHAKKLGLLPTGVRHGRYTHPEKNVRGEHVNTAVLTETKVRRMRRLREQGWTLSELSKEFGVCVSNVGYVVNRVHWKHVQ